MEQTPDAVANEVMMIRRVRKVVILVVEGSSDEKTFGKFMACLDSEFVIAWGKDNVLGAMAILDDEGVVGVLGVVDADFWHLDGESPSSPNVIVTDEHDIEMMMIRSKSFVHFIAEVASRTKLKRFLADLDAQDIRDILLERALPIGHLRRYSHIGKWNLQFNCLKFDTFVDRETISLNLEKLIEVVLALTSNSELDTGEVTSQVCALAEGCSDDPYQVCCGHDVMSILSIGLRKCIGSKSKEGASLEALESGLRMSYDSDCFRQTQLFESAKDWESRNVPYTVFC
jgi:hypothetical protein